MVIALIGNDSKFCLQLQELLQSQAHQALLIPDIAKAFARVADSRAQMVIIAGIMPQEAALELVRTLRSHSATRQLPILKVNPRGTPGDVVELLDAGADDYLVRPFNSQIFLARVRTLLRRQIWSGAAQEEPQTALNAGAISIHLVERTARLGAQEILLTRLEFELLAHLARNKDKVLKRSEILEAVWKYPQEVETRTLDKHIETLRKKLGEAGAWIRTIHGVGYRFLDPTSR